jgi:hypothetical protein
MRKTKVPSTFLETLEEDVQDDPRISNE